MVLEGITVPKSSRGRKNASNQPTGKGQGLSLLPQGGTLVTAKVDPCHFLPKLSISSHDPEREVPTLKTLAKSFRAQPVLTSPALTPWRR